MLESTYTACGAGDLTWTHTCGLLGRVWLELDPKISGDNSQLAILAERDQFQENQHCPLANVNGTTPNMAATGQAFRLCVRSSRRVPSTPRIAAARTTTTATTTQRRAFTASTTQQARKEREEIHEDPYDRKRETVEELVARLKPEEVKKLERLQKQDPEFQSMSVAESLKARIAKQRPLPPLRSSKMPRMPVQRNSFWYDDDDPTAPIDPALEEFEEDDITPMAHGKLDEIREYRHYHRIMAWEMPLLSSTLQFPFLLLPLAPQNPPSHSFSTWTERTMC